MRPKREGICFQVAMEEGGSLRNVYLVLEAGVEGVVVCCIKKDYTSGRHYSILSPLEIFYFPKLQQINAIQKA